MDLPSHSEWFSERRALLQRISELEFVNDGQLQMF